MNHAAAVIANARHVSIKRSKRLISPIVPPSNVTANFDHVKCCIQMQTNEGTHTHELSTITVAQESGEREEMQANTRIAWRRAGEGRIKRNATKLSSFYFLKVTCGGEWAIGLTEPG